MPTSGQWVTIMKTLQKKGSSLNESKNIRGHLRVKKPWNSSAIVASLGVLLNHSKYNHSVIAVGPRLERSFDALQLSFRKELSLIFSEVISGNEPSSKKMKRIFRKYYTRAYELGKASSEGKAVEVRISQEDKRWMETYLKKEYEYWKKFVKDIAKNRGRLAYTRRLDMYTSTLRSMFTSAKVIHSPAHTVFHWKTSPGERCTHCLYLEKMGPYTKENLPTVPASGDTKCRSNCRCTLNPRAVSFKEYIAVRNKNLPRNELLRRMRRL